MLSATSTLSRSKVLRLPRSSAHILDGDAVAAPTLQAATQMYRAVHLERQYVATNLCPGNGCTEANNLKLKFVAHVGEVATETSGSGANSLGSTSSWSIGC